VFKGRWSFYLLHLSLATLSLLEKQDCAFLQVVYLDSLLYLEETMRNYRMSSFGVLPETRFRFMPCWPSKHLYSTS
jgi:hypothetical protein